MKKMFLTIAVVTITVTSLQFVTACSSGGGGSGTRSYKGPGSNWSAVLNSNGTFTLEESDSSLELSGTYTTTDAGFRKLTVEESSNTGTVSVGTQAYAIDIPGVVMLLKPITTGSQIITMVKSGACPTADFTANWFVTKKDVGANASTMEVAGTFAYTHSNTSAELPNMYRADGTNLGDNDFGTVTCTDGIVTLTNQAKLFLTNNGSAIVRTFGSDNTEGGTDDGIIVAVPSASLSAVSDLDDNYVGLLFSGDAGDETPINASLSGGTLTVEEVDPDTGASQGVIGTGSGFTVNSPTTGFMKGTATVSTTGDVICSSTIDVGGSGKNFIFCVGEDPADNTELFNILLISK